jgi:Phage terminase large subunit
MVRAKSCRTEVALPSGRPTAVGSPYLSAYEGEGVPRGMMVYDSATAVTRKLDEITVGGGDYRITPEWSGSSRYFSYRSDVSVAGGRRVYDPTNARKPLNVPFDGVWAPQEDSLFGYNASAQKPDYGFLAVDRGTWRPLRGPQPFPTLVTWQDEILQPEDKVSYSGYNQHEPAQFSYPNGSVVITGGMDNPDKILSGFYDLIFWNEVTQATLEDWETLTGRLRTTSGREAGMSFRYKRIIGDCNPSSERHWVNRRANEGKMRRIRCRTQDNPLYFDDAGQATECTRPVHAGHLPPFSVG